MGSELITMKDIISLTIVLLGRKVISPDVNTAQP